MNVVWLTIYIFLFQKTCARVELSLEILNTNGKGKVALPFPKTPPSLTKWESVDSTRRFSITSMSLDHNREGKWYMASLHDKYSVGWNRTMESGNMLRPNSCTLRFFGIGYESTLTGFQHGGSGYMTIGFEDEEKKKYWHGFDKNESNKVHCYYRTNKDQGSEFLVSFVIWKYFFYQILL